MCVSFQITLIKVTLTSRNFSLQYYACFMEHTNIFNFTRIKVTLLWANYCISLQILQCATTLYAQKIAAKARETVEIIFALTDCPTSQF